MSINISGGKELRILNHSSDDVSLLTTNTRKLNINNNLTINPDEIVLDKNTTINGNLVVSGSLTSETPAIDNNRVLINTDPNVVADSTLLPVKDVRTSPVSGWYVQNAGTGDKFNFYYYGKTNPTEVHTFGDLKYLYCLGEIINGGNVFFSVYTQRQNDGNDAGSWYRSRHNYVINGTGSTIETGIRMLYVNLKEEPADIFDSVKRVQCLKEEFSSVGPKADDEQILTISLQSDSSEGAGQVEYVIQNFGFKLEHVIQNFCHITDGTGYTEGEIRTMIEGYGYQDETMVNALIATATADFETSGEIDARGYLTQPEIEALIPTPVVNNYLTFGYINANWTIVGLDSNQYFSTSNNLLIENGGAYWNTDEYTLQEAGNYQITGWISADTHYSTQFTFIVEEYERPEDGGAKNLEYRGWWNASAYGRGSTIITRSRNAGTKLKIKVYSPSAGNFPLRGFTASRFHTYFTIHKI